MKTLLIMRHAKSSWKEEHLPDHERPLNARGRSDAPDMGQLLAEQDLTPELIISSTARRARHTAELVMDSSGYSGEIILLRELYEASFETYLALLLALGEDVQRVLMVGHNPTCEDVIQRLSMHYQPMPTAALAHLRLPIERWSELTPQTRAELAGIWRPKEI